MRKEVIGDAELWLGDCNEVMRQYGHFDALVTDPPYGIGENHKKVASRGKLAAPKDYGEFDWDQGPASQDTIHNACLRCEWQVIFGGNFFALPPTSCWLVWDKMNGSNDFADCELAWTNLPKAVRRLQWLWNGMIRKGDDAREHPTQKPVGVMEWVLGHLPKDCETIFDPYMGSGSTGVACMHTGRRFVGIEIDERYFSIACRRIEQAQRQKDLFINAPVPIDPSDARAADLFAEPG